MTRVNDINGVHGADGTLPPPEFVDKGARFQALARELIRETAIGLDTEADSFFAYREKICLLQVSTRTRDYIVDPLAVDLTPFREVLAAPSVRKVFHDADYDVQLFKLAGFGDVKGIFDTRVGVSVLGGKTPGLANVLRERYGIQLDKSEQRSDWRRRPLTSEQLDYARHDTRHLLRLADDVENDIRARGLWELFDFECRRVESSAPRPRVFDAADCAGYAGARELDDAGLTALRELAVEREAAAAAIDVAAFRVAPNELLVLLARLRPRDARELAGVRSLPPRIKDAFGRGILQALTRARALPPWRPAPRPEAPPEELDAYDRLRRWRTRAAESLRIDSSCVLNRQALETLARLRPKTLDELDTIPCMSRWHREKFGEDLLRVIAG